jgi:hypothetical protein
MTAPDRRSFMAATAATIAAPVGLGAKECPTAGMDWITMSLEARNLAVGLMMFPQSARRGEIARFTAGLNSFSGGNACAPCPRARIRRKAHVKSQNMADRRCRYRYRRRWRTMPKLNRGLTSSGKSTSKTKPATRNNFCRRRTGWNERPQRGAKSLLRSHHRS